MKMMSPGWLRTLVVAAGLGLSSGCATTNHDSYTALNDGSGLEKRQPSATENMTALEKTGYYFGWFSFATLYAWAGGSAPMPAP